MTNGPKATDRCERKRRINDGTRDEETKKKRNETRGSRNDERTEHDRTEGKRQVKERRDELATERCNDMTKTE